MTKRASLKISTGSDVVLCKSSQRRTGYIPAVYITHRYYSGKAQTFAFFHIKIKWKTGQ